METQIVSITNQETEMTQTITIGKGDIRQLAAVLQGNWYEFLYVGIGPDEEILIFREGKVVYSLKVVDWQPADLVIGYKHETANIRTRKSH